MRSGKRIEKQTAYRMIEEEYTAVGPGIGFVVYPGLVCTICKFFLNKSTQYIVGRVFLRVKLNYPSKTGGFVFGRSVSGIYRGGE